MWAPPLPLMATLASQLTICLELIRHCKSHVNTVWNLALPYWFYWFLNNVFTGDFFPITTSNSSVRFKVNIMWYNLLFPPPSILVYQTLLIMSLKRSIGLVFRRMSQFCCRLISVFWLASTFVLTLCELYGQHVNNSPYRFSPAAQV